MVALSGFLTGLALIVAIGAQNAFLLRQGIRRTHVVTVVAICIASDAILIWGGVLGMSKVLASAHWVVEVMRWLGVIYLLWFAVKSAWAALSPSGEALNADDSAGDSSGTWRAAVLTTLSLTWLNPHVYLDTVVMLGGIANQYGGARWLYALGATLASVVWFFGLGFGAHVMSRYLQSPRVWRILDGFIAVLMVVIAFRLALM